MNATPADTFNHDNAMKKAKTIFRIHGSTGGERDDMLFSSATTSKDGAHYTLLVEYHHTSLDIERAKRYLKRNFDVASISTVKEKDVEAYSSTAWS